MGFILCQHCGTIIGESKEGDVREGSCNWCADYLDGDNGDEYKKQIENMKIGTNGGYY